MASDLNLDTLLIEGQTIKAEVASAISAADIERTIDGCPTLSLTIEDPHRTLLRQGYFAQRLTCQIDDHAFELAQLKKTKDQIILVMEDLAVAELRRHTDPRKADPGTVTRVEFVRNILASETPWIQLFVDPSVKEEVAKVELARGYVASASSGSSAVNESYFGSATDSSGTATSTSSTTDSASQESADYRNKVAALQGTAEDSWTCFKRIFAEVNWNLYADKGNLYAGPDSAFIDKTPAFSIVEFNDAQETTPQGDGSRNVISVDWIDFDWDVGKVIATATISCRAERWVCPPGTVVSLPNIGIPLNWVCSSIKRSVFSTVTTIVVKAPAPELPEPPAPASAGSVDAGYFGPMSDQVIDGSAGSTTGDYVWPVNGAHQITSPFGQRARDFHAGIDIACPDGTPVFASRDGTVTQVYNDPGGYGNVVYIAHRAPGADKVVGPVASTVETRYGHLSAFGCRRGQVVQQGQAIALSGHSGDATGPHLHFEIRINGKPTDPQPLLSATTPVKLGSPAPATKAPISGAFSDAELAQLLS